MNYFTDISEHFLHQKLIRSLGGDRTSAELGFGTELGACNIPPTSGPKVCVETINRNFNVCWLPDLRGNKMYTGVINITHIVRVAVTTFEFTVARFTHTTKTRQVAR